jgi:hypothetical protein
MYGNGVTFETILAGEVAAPAPAAPFLQAVAEISREAQQQQASQEIPSDGKKAGAEDKPRE